MLEANVEFIFETGFTKTELLAAKLARKVLGMVGHPSVRDLQTMAEQNLLHDNPLTVRDTQVAQKVCGPSTAMLKGETRRTTPAEVKINMIPIPRQTMEMHKDVTVDADIYFINSVPFFTSISHKMQCVTIENLADRKKATLLKAVQAVTDMCNKRGFWVKMMLMDPEFDCMEADLTKSGVDCNPAGTRDHVPLAERSISTQKQRIRCAWSRLPCREHVPLSLIHI